MIKVDLKNLGTINQNCVTISTDKGAVDLYFSYETIVAVDEVVSQNIWSKTTGKLLNDLEPNKDNRKEYDLVLKEVEKRLKNLFYSQKEQIAEEI
jgi:hypothetical protein